MAGELPELVDHTGDCAICGKRHNVAYAEGRGEEFSEDNPLAWTLYYRSESADGKVDQWCRYQRIIAPAKEPEGRERAILTLLTLRRGLCSRVHLFQIDPPSRPEQVERLRRINEQLARERKRS